MPEKPTIKTLQYWDYNEVRSFVSATLGYEIDDVTGKFSSPPDERKWDDDTVPFQCFWHWFLDQQGTIHNGSLIYLPEECELSEDEQWVKPIMDLFEEIVGGDQMMVCW